MAVLIFLNADFFDELVDAVAKVLLFGTAFVGVIQPTEHQDFEK